MVSICVGGNSDCIPPPSIGIHNQGEQLVKDGAVVVVPYEHQGIYHLPFAFSSSAVAAKQCDFAEKRHIILKLDGMIPIANGGEDILKELFDKA